MSKSVALLVNDSNIGHSHLTIVQPGTPLEELLTAVDDGALRE